MTRTRRKFLQTGAAALAGSCLAGSTLSNGPALAGESAAGTNCLDYSRSFIFGTAPFNNVRFWVESRTTIFDDQGGTSTVYYQCASCKSENTFGEKDLFLADNYDFLPILGGGYWLIFRRPAQISDRHRTTARRRKSGASRGCSSTTWPKSRPRTRSRRSVMLRPPDCRW